MTATLITALSQQELTDRTGEHQQTGRSAQLFAEHSLVYLIQHGQVDMFNHLAYWLKQMPKKGTATAPVRQVAICLSKNKMFTKIDGEYAGTVSFKPLWALMRESLTESMVAYDELTPAQLCDFFLAKLIDSGWIEVKEDVTEEKTDAQKLADKVCPKTFSGMQKYSASIQSHLKAIHLEAYGTAWTGK